MKTTKTKCPRCHKTVPAPKAGDIATCPVCQAMLVGDPTEADLEMLADDVAGKPLPRPAAQGAADMKARLAQLKKQKKKLLDRLQDGARNDDPGWDSIADLDKKIKEAQERLGGYKTQQKGLN